MGFGASLLLTAAGAILAWAVNAPNSTVNVHLVGVVLLIVGLVGMGLSLALWSTWAGPGYFVRGRRTVVDRDGVGYTEERTTRY
jgi:hypothetical protein